MRPSSPSFAFKHRSHRRLTRGVTLIEVMVVVVILSLIASAVALAVFPQHLKAQQRVAHISASTMRAAASSWRMENPGDSCPTPERLRDDRMIDSGSKLTDPWETPYRIKCEGSETIVISLGPDRKESSDDIVEPEPIAMREYEAPRRAREARLRIEHPLGAAS